MSLSLTINKPNESVISVSFGAPVTPTCALSPYSPCTPTITIHLSTTPLAAETDSAAVIVDDDPPVMSSNELPSFRTEPEDQTLDTILLQNGYKYIRKTSNTLQGAVYEAEIMDPDKKATSNCTCVAIKQASKHLHQKREAKQDGFNVIVEENIIKEATILKYLTRDNRTNHLYIARFIDFFETEDHLYLVMEYAGECNLARFVAKAHQFIAEKKLNLADYKKVVKFLFWQIAVTMEYMHSLGVCHLDLSLENIVVRGGLSNFIVNDSDGSVTIDSNIAVKIVDFGLSEVFHPACSSFNVRKWGLRNSFDTTSPEVYAELPFDGMKTDIWSAGVVLYQLLTGHTLYTIPDEEVDAGFYSISHDKLVMYLCTQGLSKYLGKKSLNLLRCMLNVNESKRMDAMEVLKSWWFASYYKKYAPLIEIRSKSQKYDLDSHSHTKAPLPYYECQ